MKVKDRLTALSRSQKRFISIVVDGIGVIAMTLMALSLRLGGFDIDELERYLFASALLPIIAIPLFIVRGLYRAVIRYIGYHFSMVVFNTVTMVMVLWMTAIFLLDLPFPRTAIVITGLLLLFYVLATRLFVRWLLSDRRSQKKEKQSKKIIIFGAGQSGQQLLHAMSNLHTHRVVAFIDDDEKLLGHDIASIRVYARDDLGLLIERYDASELLIATPSLNPSQKKVIIDWASIHPVKLTSLPAMDHIIDGKVSFTDVQDVDIEDLLGRDSVAPNPELLDACIRDKVVMVTGAGGSIGSELCRQAIKQQPKQLILLELNEYALYKIEAELIPLVKNNSTEVIAVLGNITDQHKMQHVIEMFVVQTIYHAAAYKHVPIVEHNIREGMLNNAIGTANLAQIAADKKVENFVLISTDKAVRPTNFMGASKRLAEMALQALQAEKHSTRFIMVRFGNVLASSGSVIPLFKKQIEQGGPVTVTHKEITRYFMTIPEAATLVIQAGSMGTGGDVFVLDMGDSVKIDQLARKLIQLSGFDVVDAAGNGSIEIHYTGLRPGEKLYEELLIGDNVDGTEHSRIMTAHEPFIPYKDLLSAFELLTENLNKNQYDEVEQQLMQLVSGFQHQGQIVDHLYQDKANA